MDRASDGIRARRPGVLVALALAIVLVTASCTDAGSPRAVGSRPAVSADRPAAQPAAVVGSPIPQPPLPSGVPVAPDSERVDLTYPRFSDPTHVTNPLFPVSRQRSVLFVGHVDGRPFRTEVTLLPYTRVLEWGGQRIETLVSQYTAYLGGRLQEVAYDLYAQADDDSVWYFGEDVADLENGAIVTKEGTWLSGKDGPAQMIMPGHPRVRDVYRAENIPGIAFEQVTVRANDRRLRGPMGPIARGMVGQELHMDGTTEYKLFAPGYGEFYTGSGGDVEALALAVPTDAAHRATPEALAAMLDAAYRLVVPPGHELPEATPVLEDLDAARTRLPDSSVPRLIGPRLDRALAGLRSAARAGDDQRIRVAAVEVARWCLDLDLRYRPVVVIDMARFGLWAQQLRIDADRRDAAAVRGDAFSLFYLRDRVIGSVSPQARNTVNTAIGSIQEAVVDHDLRAAADAAATLQTVVRQRADLAQR